MPKFTTSSPVQSSGPVLPAFVREYLSSGAPEGARNDTIYKVAQQFHAAGLPQADCEAQVLPVAIGQGGERVRTEVLNAIRSGYASTKVTEPLKGGGGNGSKSQSPQRPGAQKMHLTGAAAMIAALEAAFKPGDSIAICPARLVEDTWKPGNAVIHTLEGWKKRLPKALDDCEGGCYIAINPLKPGSERRLNENVSAYRHVLVEWDTGDTADQERKLRECGFPVSVIVSSGGRSVHGWVRVDAPDYETWNQRRQEVFRALACDEKNKDLARVSRLPGFMRGENEQRLIAVNVGPESWAAMKTDELPPFLSLRDLLVTAPQAPPEVVQGVLYTGTKMMLGGPSKARKSWVLLDLALSVALGLPWLGFPTTKGKVLFVNFELLPFMLYDRLCKISASKRCKGSSDDMDSLQFWNLRGRVSDLADLTPLLLERLRGGRYSLLILDPIYKGLGARDENAAGDINSLLNELERVCRETGVAIVYSHHFAKGDASTKHALDRTSGSGVWARDPDTVFSLTPPAPLKRGEEKPKWDFEVDVTARAHPRLDPFFVTWAGSHYERDSGQKFVLKPREGSMADKWGPVVAEMPPLSREAAEEWLSQKMDGSIEEARAAFDALRKDRYAFVRWDSDAKTYTGRNYRETNPF